MVGGGVGAGVHHASIRRKAREVGEQAGFLGPVERVGGVEVGDGDAIAGDPRAALHMLFEDGEHLAAVAPGVRDVGRDAILLVVDRGVERDAPERLFDIGREEEVPAMHLGAVGELLRDEAFLRILLRKVILNRDGLRDDDVAVDESGHLAGRVDRQEGGLLVFAGRQVDGHDLASDADLVDQPNRPQGARRRNSIEFHCRSPCCRQARLKNGRTCTWSPMAARIRQARAIFSRSMPDVCVTLPSR